MPKTIFLLLAVLLLTGTGIFGQTLAGAAAGFDPHYKIIFHNAVEDKNFYLLSLLQRQEGLRKKLEKNKELQKISRHHQNDLRVAAECLDVQCYDRVFRLKSDEVETVARVFKSDIAGLKLTKLVNREMRPSGFFIKYDSLDNAALLAAAWLDAAKGLNRILDVYGLGKAPQYNEIDSVSYDVGSDRYKNLLKEKVGRIDLPKAPLFFEPMLDYALKLLEANRRDEAGRHEPLEQTENKRAFDNLKNIKWNDFPYSVILVLGSGPSAKLGDAPNIGKIGIERADEAVKLYQEKKAPLIILSGGYVHPAQTPYSEAIEMKKYIIQKYGIDEKAILIDPFARHTTTNIRNAARIMFRDRIPADKTAIVTSTASHIDYVAGDQFAKRNMDELGFVPMQIFKRISPVAVEFKPLPIALFMNSLDPLDP